MTTPNTDARGRFSAGNKASPGRPKSDPADLNVRRLTRELRKRAKPIDALLSAAEPVLLAMAIERADQDNAVLAGVLHLMATRRDAANIAELKAREAQLAPASH